MVMDFLLSIFPIFIIFLIFYFIVIRPQSKAESKRKEFLKNIRKGEIVYLSSGIIGKVADVGEQTLLLEIAKDVKIRVLKDAIQGQFVEKTSTASTHQAEKQTPKQEEKASQS